MCDFLDDVSNSLDDMYAFENTMEEEDFLDSDNLDDDIDFDNDFSDDF